MFALPSPRVYACVYACEYACVYACEYACEYAFLYACVCVCLPVWLIVIAHLVVMSSYVVIGGTVGVSLADRVCTFCCQEFGAL